MDHVAAFNSSSSQMVNRDRRIPHTIANAGETGLEGNLQQMKLQDCVHYMQTGSCTFGARCHYNHPTAKKMHVVTPGHNMEELPDRPGQLECQFYIKTGTCRFGHACRYHHPRPKDESDSNGGQVQLNFLGLPLRPGEKECAYYLQTGSCKYGGTCRFHHPQPTTAGTMLPVSNSSVYSPSSAASPAPVPYQGGVPSCPVARSPFIPSGSGMPRPPSYGPVLVSSPQAISMPGSTAYKQQGLSSQMLSVDGGPQAAPRGFSYGKPQQQLDATATGVQGFGARPANSIVPSSHREIVFPERPGQPDCHYYMKTGDCKFGTNCKYHHPKDRSVSLPLGLNPMGLPLRPGKPPCTFYVRRGICKFGPVCKFDHPVGVSLSSLNEMPAAPYVPELFLITPASTSPERPYEVSKVEELQAATLDEPNVQFTGNGNTQQIISAQNDRDDETEGMID